MKPKVNRKSTLEENGHWMPQIGRDLRQAANVAGWEENMSGAAFVDRAVRAALRARGKEVAAEPPARAA